jgi:hypothetical protein
VYPAIVRHATLLPQLHHHTRPLSPTATALQCFTHSLTWYIGSMAASSEMQKNRTDTWRATGL